MLYSLNTLPEYQADTTLGHSTEPLHQAHGQHQPTPNGTTRRLARSKHLTWAHAHLRNTLKLQQSLLFLPPHSQPHLSTQWRNKEWWLTHKTLRIRDHGPNPFRHPQRYNPQQYEDAATKYHRWYTHCHPHLPSHPTWQHMAWDHHAWTTSLHRYVLSA